MTQRTFITPYYIGPVPSAFVPGGEERIAHPAAPDARPEHVAGRAGCAAHRERDREQRDADVGPQPRAHRCQSANWVSDLLIRMVVACYANATAARGTCTRGTCSWHPPGGRPGRRRRHRRTLEIVFDGVLHKHNAPEPRVLTDAFTTHNHYGTRVGASATRAPLHAHMNTNSSH